MNKTELTNYGEELSSDEYLYGRGIHDWNRRHAEVLRGPLEEKLALAKKIHSTLWDVPWAYRDVTRIARVSRAIGFMEDRIAELPTSRGR